MVHDVTRSSRWTRQTLACLMFLAIGVGCSDNQSPAISPSARQHQRAQAEESLRTYLAAETASTDAQVFSDRESPSAGDRFLIIHADDAGMCESVNRGTIEALEAGLVTSVSIMVPCPAFEEFADYAHAHPEYDYGVHLTLNAEFVDYRWGPVLPQGDVPSLVDGGGYLWRTEHQVAANARADEVERELRAQIDRALSHHVPLSHLDSHMGTLFMRPDFVDVYLRLSADYNLPILLSHDDTFLRQLGVDARVIANLPQTATALEEQGFPVLDDIKMHYSWDSPASKKRAYGAMIQSVQPGITEIIIHCAVDNSELRDITGSYQVRDGDRQVFTDPAFVADMQQADVTLVSWKQLMRARPQATVAD